MTRPTHTPVRRRTRTAGPALRPALLLALAVLAPAAVPGGPNGATAADGILADPLAPGAGDGDCRRTVTVRAVARVYPSVVNLHSVKTTYDDEPVFGSRRGRKVNGMGTGIVIDPRGYLATNHHVVHEVESLRAVTADGSTYRARVISSDPVHDLAVVKIDPRQSLPVMPLGTSCDLMLGETVIAVGNAFGYEGTLSRGIVSALHRDVEVTETQSYRNLIQTDAAINPGNSGGPLVNLRGEVIGINVAIRAGAQRIGFAIPIDDAREVLADLLSVERIEGRRHGLTLADRKTPTEQAARVVGMRPGSPGALAGLRPGDLLVRVGQVPIHDRVDFERVLLGVNQSVMLTLVRDGRPTRLPLTMPAPGGRPSARTEPSPPPAPAAAAVPRTATEARRTAARVETGTARDTPAAGADVYARLWDAAGVRLTPAARRDVERADYAGGFTVVGVRTGGPADAAGLRRGDVLVGLHDFSTVKLADLAFVLNHDDLPRWNPLKFYIVRDGETHYGHLRLTTR